MESIVYRGICACGRVTGLERTVIETKQAHKSHVRDQIRAAKTKLHGEITQQAKAAIKAAHGFSRWEEVTPEKRAEERIVADREWLTYLRVTQLPRQRAELVARCQAVATRLIEQGERLHGEITRRADNPAELVEHVQHEVLWMVANLNLDRLVGALATYQSGEQYAAGMALKLAKQGVVLDEAPAESAATA